jgi:predicted Na+-dependent transporter
MEFLHTDRILEDAEPDASTPENTVTKILVQLLSNVLLFILIFGMSATVDIRRIKQQLRNCYAISAGICMQFLIMPLLGFVAVIILKNYGLTTPMGITLLIVTSSPGGSYSNWWCSLFNADLALSVAMTALSTFISIAALPANLLLYTHFAYGFDGNQEKNILASVDFKKLIISLSIVICAILCGLFASYKIPSKRFQRVSNASGTLSGIVLIAVSAVFSTNGGSTVKPWNQHWSFYIGVGLPCVAGLALANVIAKLCRLKAPEVVTLSVECSYQNTGIATSAVLAMFDDPDQVAQAMAVPLFYGVVEMGAIGLYCLVAWKLGWTKAPSGERICTVMSKTYEVEDSDGDDITALQNSVDPNNKDITMEEGRVRVDTLMSEDTLPMSISDVSSNDTFSGSGHPSNQTPHTSNENLQHTRSLPNRLQLNEVAVQPVFHTIREESETENSIEVCEHRLRHQSKPDESNHGIPNDKRLLSLRGDVDEFHNKNQEI